MCRGVAEAYVWFGAEDCVHAINVDIVDWCGLVGVKDGHTTTN